MSVLGHSAHRSGARSRCASSSARGRSRTGPARTTIRATSRNGCRCSTSAARGPPGADTFPTKAQLDETDVLILHKQEAGNIEEADRKNLNEYLARGGGLVVIHAGLVSRDPDWFKTIVGGSWRNGTAKWLEGPMHLYFTDRDSPITKGASNWEMDDEIYYDLDMLPDVTRPRVGLHAEGRRARATPTSSAAPTS